MEHTAAFIGRAQPDRLAAGRAQPDRPAAGRAQPDRLAAGRAQPAPEVRRQPGAGRAQPAPEGGRAQPAPEVRRQPEQSAVGKRGPARRDPAVRAARRLAAAAHWARRARVARVALAAVVGPPAAPAAATVERLRKRDSRQRSSSKLLSSSGACGGLCQSSGAVAKLARYTRTVLPGAREISARRAASSACSRRARAFAGLPYTPEMRKTRPHSAWLRGARSRPVKLTFWPLGDSASITRSGKVSPMIAANVG